MATSKPEGYVTFQGRISTIDEGGNILQVVARFHVSPESMAHVRLGDQLEFTEGCP